MMNLDQALSMAEKLHSGQVDKAGKPYFGHIQRVVGYVELFAPPEKLRAAQIAAAFHDSVEDTEATFKSLAAAGVSEEVISAIDSVTRRVDEDYFDMVRRAAADPIGKYVKLADNYDNTDPVRVAALPPEKAARFAIKYAKAVAILNEAPE